jgi:hypothetical protein
MDVDADRLAIGMAAEKPMPQSTPAAHDTVTVMLEGCWKVA